LWLAVRDDTVVVFFTLQIIEKAKCNVEVQLARSIVNGLVHEFDELNLFCLAKLLCYYRLMLGLVGPRCLSLTVG